MGELVLNEALGPPLWRYISFVLPQTNAENFIINSEVLVLVRKIYSRSEKI